jgi:hypothetical protein
MIRYLSGVISGVYACQLYNIPDISEAITTFLEYLRRFEKPPPKL